MPTRIDITGGKYTHLTAIAPRGSNKAGATLWLFRCDCGNERELPLKAVTAGRIRTCGKCKLSSKLKGQRGAANGRTTLAWQALYGRALRRARKEGIEWGLTIDEFKSISICPCRLCGTPARIRFRGTSVRYSEVAPVSSTAGCTTENVTALCRDCFQMKGKLSVSQLIHRIYEIYKHLS